MRVLPHGVEEELVHPRVVGELGMEGCGKTAALPQQDGLAVQLGQHLDVVPHALDSRSADEDAPQRLLLAGELETGLEARHLTPERVATNVDVEQPEELLSRS